MHNPQAAELQEDTDALALLERGPAPPSDALGSLLQERPAMLSTAAFPAVIIGELVAMADDGQTPLVRYPGQPGNAAVRARSMLNLHGPHIGKSVVLSFEGGNACLPIVMGVLKTGVPQAFAAPADQVEIDADGQRMVVSAREQLVLKCGKASITLTKAGKVLIAGSHVSSYSSGMNRIKGGAVQIN